LYIKDKESLSLDDIKYLASLKASLGRGLTGKLLELFPDIKHANRPLIEGTEALNPH